MQELDDGDLVETCDKDKKPTAQEKRDGRYAAMSTKTFWIPLI
jgi:hypothetical protein